MRLILVGPSHIPRIRHALEVVRLPRPIDDILYLGDGGYPVWKKSVYTECCDAYQKGDKILLIVADFRFGNSILIDESLSTEGAAFFDGHTHVKRDLCTPENDEKMKQLCVNALNAWKARFGDDVIILHWTLALRTVKNRLSRQHIDKDGNYRHPVWNIDDPDFISDIHGLSSVQTAQDLGICNSLTIDNDLHPSTLGYLYIIACAATSNHEASLNAAKTIYMSGINSLTAKLAGVRWPKSLIAGPSKVLNSLHSALPKSSRDALSQAGLTIRAQGEVTPELVNEQAIEHLIYISDSAINDMNMLNAAIAELHIKFSSTTKAKVSILFWDAIATQVMQWRARSQRDAPTGSIEKNLAATTFHAFWPASQTFEFQSIDKLIEYGAGGAPTFWGVVSIITRVTHLAASDIASAVVDNLHKSARTSPYRLGGTATTSVENN